jgi:hypothetical protein
VPQERRVGENQALFREVNERVRSLNQALSLGVDTWICECANTGCFQRVELAASEYADVRSHPARFLVYPDESHVAPEAERVVDRNERYWVVEKLGEARRAAVDAHRRGK